MTELYHIAYISFSYKSLSEKELKDLLLEIRKKNADQKITGLLLYNNESFIQVVEGERKTLENLFERIKQDKRHDNIVKLIEEPITKRTFPDWSMGFEIVDNKKIKKIPGYSNFINVENTEEIVKNGAKEIMQLLNSFKAYT